MKAAPVLQHLLVLPRPAGGTVPEAMIVSGQNCYGKKSQNASFSRNTKGECNLQLLILRNLNPSPFRVYKLSHPRRGSHLSEEGNLLSCPLAPNHVIPTRQPFPETCFSFISPTPWKLWISTKMPMFSHRFWWCLIFGKLNEKLLKGRL